MVWHCEDCKEDVNVNAEITADSSFDKEECPENIQRIMRRDGEILLRCEKCDSTRVVWRE